MGEGRVRPAVKICGITRLDDAAAVGAAGADFVGAVLTRGLRRSVAPDIAGRFPAVAGRPLVGVTVDESLETLVALARSTGAAVLQLHGAEPPSLLAALRDEGEWEVWKAVKVRTVEGALDAVHRYRDVADGLLLDGWHPELDGGSGARFPWDLVESVRHLFPDELRLVVAGGLDPDNVNEAADRLRPDVVDVSSGVERALGIKDPARIRAFIRAAKGAEVA